MDFGKKKTTDSRHNSKVGLAKEVDKEQETFIDLRRNRFFRIHTRCRHREGKGKSNLPDGARLGLKSLEERTKDGDLIVMETDKSGKLAVCEPEAYLRMGEEHVKEDREITIKEVLENARVSDAHTSCWIKMMGVGEQHRHTARFRESYMGGDTPAAMTLLAKDHKPQNKDGTYKTRPVVMGNTSYNVGLSEMLSELLEAT